MKPLGPVQIYDIPPDEDSEIAFPEHTGLLDEMEVKGVFWIITVVLPVEVQPFESVVVTL